jgi:hypothetical protein
MYQHLQTDEFITTLPTVSDPEYDIDAAVSERVAIHTCGRYCYGSENIF